MYVMQEPLRRLTFKERLAQKKKLIIIIAAALVAVIVAASSGTYFYVKQKRSGNYDSVSQLTAAQQAARTASDLTAGYQNTPTDDQKQQAHQVADEAMAAAKSNPDKVAAYQAKAIACQSTGDTACVVKMYEYILAIDKTYNSFVQAGDAAEKAGDKAKALEYYKKALETGQKDNAIDDEVKSFLNDKIKELGG
jgi:tetratricopeptide (TPR) repeat protein